MTRAILALTGLLREPERPVTARPWLAYLGRLIAFYTLAGVLGALAYAVIMTAYALASAPQLAPDRASAAGCPVVLPDPGDGGSVALRVRTAHALSECDGSSPVGFGASVGDSGTGRAR